MIKMIAVDMDGTFLDSNMRYDIKRFERIYQHMKENEILFVVASGNQYFQLKSFFPHLDHEIAYVAENGAMVIDRNELIHIGAFDPQDVKDILSLIEERNLKHVIQCTPTMAYVIQDEPMMEMAKKYYHQLKETTDFHLIQDPTIKFNLNFEESKTDELVDLFNTKFEGRIKAVSSGHGNLDLITQSTSKAEGLKKLAASRNISFDQVVSFGDGGNDVDMLVWAGQSYAMNNAPDKIKDIAKSIAPSNNDSGVLVILEKLFNL